MNEELIVLLNDDGQEIGTAEKFNTHHADTPLHKAFSCYVFNDTGKLLVTKRAAVKRVWPGVWTNSVCGHPFPGESDEDAIERRLEYELSMRAEIIQCIVKDYRYKTPPFRGIIEHELCPIYIAVMRSEPQPNPVEVDDYNWLEWDEYVQRISADENNQYSWWCKDQLKYIKSSVEDFLQSNAVN